MFRLNARAGVFSILSIVVAFFGISPVFGRQGPGLRLIETGSNQRMWMTPAQVSEFSRQLRAQGKLGGFIDVTDHPTLQASTMAKDAAADFWFRGQTPSHPDQVEPLIKEISAERLGKLVEEISEKYADRYYNSNNGFFSSLWIKELFAKASAGRTDISVTDVGHVFWQHSVIARIEGKGPHADEIVIIGAHLDSVNSDGFSASSNPAPGADDDASGTATVLEIFRILAASGFQPNRSLEFMAYAGEEGGLLGSQDIVSSYKKKKVVAVLQLDMTMYEGNNPGIKLISDNVDPKLTEFVALLIDTYVHVPWSRTPCGYGCSDHASWTRAGFPSAFPFEATMSDYNPSIHTQGDVFENLRPVFGSYFAMLAMAYAVELGLAD